MEGTTEMSTRSKAAATLASAGILLAGWNIGTANGKTVTTGVGTTAVGTTGSRTSGTGPSAADGSSSAVSYTGATRSDRFGSITVTVTLTGGKITDVTYTTTVRDSHSAQIEARAIPTLKAAVLKANSADVSTVSGATYTTEKYLSSLQSALDQAA